MVGEDRFIPLAQIDSLKLDLTRAEATLRAKADVRSRRGLWQPGNRGKTVAWFSLAALLMVSASMGARFLAVHTPWRTTVREEDVGVTIEPGTIHIAIAAPHLDDYLAYPSQLRLKSRTPSRVIPRNSLPSSGIAGREAGKVSLPEQAPDADGLQTANFDRSAINLVVGAQQRTLYPCLIPVAHDHPTAKSVPIEFVIGNDGRVSQVWVDNPEIKGGNLNDCLLKQLQKWPFKPYPGERATVGLSFKLGKG